MLRSLSSLTMRFSRLSAAAQRFSLSSSAIFLQLSTYFSSCLLSLMSISPAYSSSESFLRQSSRWASIASSSILYLRRSFLISDSRLSILSYSSGENSRLSLKSLMRSEASNSSDDAFSIMSAVSLKSSAMTAALPMSADASSVSDWAFWSAAYKALYAPLSASVSFSEFLRRSRFAVSSSSSPTLS